MEIAKLYATIGADTKGLTRGLEESHSALGNFKTSMQGLQTAVAGACAAAGVAALAMGGAVVKTGFDFLAMKEQADIAFTTMLGSGQAAQGMLDELQSFAAKTPFEFPDLIRASQRMMAMGFSATEVIPTLTAVGDAVAALGGTSETVDRVTTALGQMQAKGKTSAEEMMQLTEAGIPAWQMLADKIGVSVPEAMKMVTKGAVDAKTTISAVVDGIDERFGGMMAKQATTWNGLLSNLKDNFAQISGAVMKPFFDMAKVGLEKLVVASNAFFDSIKAGNKPFVALQAGLAKLLPPELLAAWERFISGVEKAIEVIKTVTKPITDAIGKMFDWQDVLTGVAYLLGSAVLGAIGAVVAAMWPFIAVIAAVAAASAALRWAWENDFMQIRTFTLSTLKKLSDWFYTESGIWKGTWEKTMEYLTWWANGGWKMNIAYPVRSWLLGMRDEIENWSLRTIKKIELWISEAKNSFSHGLSVIVGTVLKWRDDIVSAVIHWTDKVLDKIDYWAARADTLFTVFYNNTMGPIRRWKDDMIERFQGVFDWWDAHVSPWVNKGKAIIQGLWDGAKQVWTRFKDWWGDIWRTLTGTVDVKLRIGSPSKEMVERGKAAVEGFAIGAQQAMSLAMGAMGSLATGAMGTAGYGGYGASAESSDAALISETNMLLRTLISTLAAKNMTANVNVVGGGADPSMLVGMASGLRG